MGGMAEEVRFELTDPCESTVFKTVAIDHSATLPGLLGSIVTGLDSLIHLASRGVPKR